MLLAIIGSYQALVGLLGGWGLAALAGLHGTPFHCDGHAALGLLPHIHLVELI